MLRSNSPVMMARPMIPVRNTSCSALYQSPRRFGTNELANSIDRNPDIAGCKMSARFERSGSTKVRSNSLQVLVVGDKENQSKTIVDPPKVGTKVFAGQKAVFCHELTQCVGQLPVPQAQIDDVPAPQTPSLLVPRLQSVAAGSSTLDSLQFSVDHDLVNWYKSKAATEFSQAEVVVLLKTQADVLRNEFNCMSARMINELEARFTQQIEEVKSTTSEQVTALEARMTEKMQAIKTEPLPLKDEDLRPIATSRNEDFVNDVSDHVIAKVNAVLESLESLKDNSSKLLQMLGKKVPVSKGNHAEEHVLPPNELMLETPPKCSTPVTSDGRRVYQRCNRDRCDPSAQFWAPEEWSEEKLAHLELALLATSASQQDRCIAGTGEAGDTQDDLDETDYLEAVIKPCNGIQISVHSL